jgi:hypothetical protein
MSSNNINLNKQIQFNSLDNSNNRLTTPIKQKDNSFESNNNIFSNNKLFTINFSSEEKSINESPKYNIESPYKNCLTNELIKTLNYYGSYNPKNKEDYNQIDSISTFNKNDNSQFKSNEHNFFLGNKIIRSQISCFNSSLDSSTEDNKSLYQSFNSYNINNDIHELDKQLDYINYSLKNILPKSFPNLIKDESNKINSFQFISCFNHSNNNNNKRKISEFSLNFNNLNNNKITNNKRNISDFSLNFNNLNNNKIFNNLNTDNNNLNNFRNNNNLNGNNIKQFNFPNQLSFMFSKNKNENKKPMKKKQKIEIREGDWICHKCNNLNFYFRNVCNKCKSLKSEEDKFNGEKKL